MISPKLQTHLGQKYFSLICQLFSTQRITKRVPFVSNKMHELKKRKVTSQAIVFLSKIYRDTAYQFVTNPSKMSSFKQIDSEKKGSQSNL